jgi:anti-sigma-K factor RskA
MHDDDRPDPRVWRAIHDDLGLDPSLAADPLDESSADGRRSDHAPSTATSRPPRIRAWRAAAIVAAAVIAVLLVVLVADRVNAPAPTAVAEATLVPLPGWKADGQATVEVARDGQRTIIVNLAATVRDGDLREVWLMRSDLKGLVSLGFLDGTSGRFTVPSEIDLAEYDLVDVSAEPDDGNPAHSGDSIARGTLKPV